VTTEQLREKNNASETKNLKTYKSLLDRAEQLINVPPPSKDLASFINCSALSNKLL
jgi:hypothetical protein